MLRRFCFLILLLSCVPTGLSAQLFLSRRVRLDIRTPNLSIEGVQVLQATPDSLKVFIPKTERVIGMKVEELEYLRVYRTSQWKRGLWVGLGIGAFLARWVGEELDFYPAILAGSIPLGVAILNGHSRQFDLASLPGADMAETYHYLYPWLRRASILDTYSEKRADPFSTDYQLYPYLRPRRIQLSASWGWSGGQMHRDLGQVIQLAGPVFDYGEYPWGSSGGHVRLQAAYSPNAFLRVGAWLAPGLSLARTGTLGIYKELSSTDYFAGSATLHYQINQNLFGLFGEVSPWRDDKRYIHHFVPKLGIGLWTSGASGVFSIRGYGYAESINLEFAEASSARAQKWGADLSLGCDWYVSRYFHFTARLARIFPLGQGFFIPETSVQIEEIDERIGTPATIIPMQVGSLTLGIGLRI